MSDRGMRLRLGVLAALAVGCLSLARPGAAEAEAAGPASPTASPPACTGQFKQGGLLICRAEPGTVFRFGDDAALEVGEEGAIAYGLARDADPVLDLAITAPDGRRTRSDIAIATREDPFRVIRGLDCDKVDARTEAQKAHAARSWQKKQTAFATFHAPVADLATFQRPAEGRPSSPFGPERKYIGVSAETGEPCEKVSVHRGYDIAAPIGTEIIAPAPGTVILAEPDLYYEGGTVFLDHGLGLVSVFLHMSAVDVAVGDRIDTGDRLGAVGNTGRTTGPHLHWAVKWRDTGREARGNDRYIDPALLLETGSAERADWAASR